MFVPWCQHSLILSAECCGAQTAILLFAAHFEFRSVPGPKGVQHRAAGILAEGDIERVSRDIEAAPNRDRRIWA